MATKRPIEKTFIPTVDDEELLQKYVGELSVTKSGKKFLKKVGNPEALNGYVFNLYKRTTISPEKILGEYLQVDDKYRNKKTGKFDGVRTEFSDFLRDLFLISNEHFDFVRWPNVKHIDTKKNKEDRQRHMKQCENMFGKEWVKKWKLWQ